MIRDEPGYVENITDIFDDFNVDNEWRNYRRKWYERNVVFESFIKDARYVARLLPKSVKCLHIFKQKFMMKYGNIFLTLMQMYYDGYKLDDVSTVWAKIPDFYKANEAYRIYAFGRKISNEYKYIYQSWNETAERHQVPKMRNLMGILNNYARLSSKTQCQFRAKLYRLIVAGTLPRIIFDKFMSIPGDKQYCITVIIRMRS